MITCSSSPTDGRAQGPERGYEDPALAWRRCSPTAGGELPKLWASPEIPTRAGCLGRCVRSLPEVVSCYPLWFEPFSSCMVLQYRGCHPKDDALADAEHVFGFPVADVYKDVDCEASRRPLRTAGGGYRYGFGERASDDHHGSLSIVGGAIVAGLMVTFFWAGAVQETRPQGCSECCSCTRSTASKWKASTTWFRLDARPERIGVSHAPPASTNGGKRQWCQVTSSGLGRD